MAEQPPPTADDTDAAFDPDKYRTDHGTVPHKIDVSDEDHPVKQELGDSDHIEFKFDSHTTTDRFAFRYDDPTAAFREYLANAETACVRRCRLALHSSHRTPEDVDPDELKPREAVAYANEYTDYDPKIEVDHAAHESDFPAFQIRDNGVGMSVEEFRVLRNIGLSASHGTGQDLGTFGQGVLSAFPCVGKYGDVECVTYSMNDETSYGFRMRIDGMNYTDDRRTAYGTTFTFPAFGYDVRDDIDVQSAIEQFSRGLQVPVLYREFDDTNTEVANEEYTPTDLTERYDATPIVWEDPNGFVTAVMWPSVSNHTSSAARTFNLSMPIERNDKSWSVSKYEAPYHFDLRINYEDGRILHDPDGEHTGQIPIEPRGYEELDDADKPRHVPKDELDGNELRLPEPVDDRDRFKSGYDDTYRYISEQLKQSFYDAVTGDFERLADEGLDYLLNLDEEAGELFRVAWEKFKPPQNRARDSRVEKAFTKVDVDIDDETVSEIAAALREVQYAERFDTGATRNRNRESMSALEYIAQYEPSDDSEGTTYMSARTIHTYGKAKLAWECHEDNQVIVVGSARRYETYEELFGWEKLKDFSLYDILDEHPELDTSVAKKLERGDYFADEDEDDDEPTDYTQRTRPVTVRTQGKRWTKTAGQVYDTLDCDGAMQFGRETIEELIVLREVDGHKATTAHEYTNQKNGLARMVVPNYVADFLTQLPQVYDGTDAIDRRMADIEIQATDPSIFGDGSRETIRENFADIEELSETTDTSVTLGSIGSDTVIISHSSRIDARAQSFGVEVYAEYFDYVETALTELDHELDSLADAEQVLFVIDTPTAVSDADSIEPSYYETGIGYDVDGDPAIIEAGGTMSGSIDAPTIAISADTSEIHIDALLPESVFPRDSPEWEVLKRGAKYSRVGNIGGRMEAMVKTLGQLRPDEIDEDTEPVFVSASDD